MSSPTWCHVRCGEQKKKRFHGVLTLKLGWFCLCNFINYDWMLIENHFYIFGWMEDFCSTFFFFRMTKLRSHAVHVFYVQERKTLVYFIPQSYYVLSTHFTYWRQTHCQRAQEHEQSEEKKECRDKCFLLQFTIKTINLYAQQKCLNRVLGLLYYAYNRDAVHISNSFVCSCCWRFTSNKWHMINT